jgi:MFS family permease
VIFLTVFIYLLGFGIVIPIIPLLSQDFGATAFQAGLLLSMYSLTQFLFAPFWGRLSVRIGRRKVLLGCLLGVGLTYILFAYARNLEMLFLARLLAGFFGASISTASAAISDITPPNERSKGMALIGAAFGLGFMFGPAIGGLLSMWSENISTAPHFQSSFVMLWVAGICFATFLFGLKFLKETLSPQNRPPERKNRWKLLAENFSRPTVGLLMLVFFFASFAMSSMEATLVLFMKERFNWGLREVSFGFAYIGVMITLTQGLIVRRLLPKIGERQTMIWGLMSFTLGLAGIAISSTLFGMMITMTLLSLGNGLANPSILGSISLLTPSSEQGFTMGSTQSLASLGRILGPIFGGFLFQQLHVTAPFLAGTAFSLLALLIVLKMGTRVPDAATGRGAIH